MSRHHRRYDAGAAARRTRSTTDSASIPFTAGSTPTRDASTEYTLLSVRQIQPAPWQPRRVFEHLEELAATIAGTDESDGLGVLEPVLVRRVGDDSYELIDGERRLRACRLLAERSPSGDFSLPARVFDVSERVARLMGQTANLERDEPKPYEVAVGYQRIREAIQAEAGGVATGVRGLAALGRHGKSQVADYLRIADALTPDVLAAAGIAGEEETPDFATFARLSKKDLHTVAKMQSVEDRVRALRTRLDKLTGAAPRQRRDDESVALTPEERRMQVATVQGWSVRVRVPAQLLEPSQAAEVVEHELVPGLLALAERAYAGSAGSGFLSSHAVAHALLVLPGEVEALSLLQLERLTGELTALAQRTRRALRLRRQVANGLAASTTTTAAARS